MLCWGKQTIYFLQFFFYMQPLTFKLDDGNYCCLICLLFILKSSLSICMVTLDLINSYSDVKNTKKYVMMSIYIVNGKKALIEILTQMNLSIVFDHNKQILFVISIVRPSFNLGS